MESVGIAIVEGHENLNAWSPRSGRKRSGPRIDNLEVPGQNLEVGCKILGRYREAPKIAAGLHARDPVVVECQEHSVSLPGP